MIIQFIHSAVSIQVVPGFFTIGNSSAINIPVQVPGIQVQSPPVTCPVNSSGLSSPQVPTLPSQRYHQFDIHFPVPWLEKYSQADKHGEPGVHLMCFPSLKYQSVLPAIQLLKTAAPEILSSFIVVQDSKVNPILITMSRSEVEVYSSLFSTESFSFVLGI